MLDHDVDQLTTKKLASRLLDDCSSLGVPTLRFHLNFLNRLLPWRDMLGAPNLEGISTGKTPYHIYIFGVGNNIYGSLENYELYISIQPTNWLQFLSLQALWFQADGGFLKPVAQALNPETEHFWLVVYLPLWKIWVSWDDDIPNIWKNNPNVPNHQSV